MTRMLKAPPSGTAKVAIADASGLLFSDDYRSGWKAGFIATGADVRVFDVGILSKIPRSMSGPYSIGSAGRTAKMVAREIVKWGPDLVFCHHGRYTGLESFLSEFDRHGIRTAAYLCDEPYECGESVRYGALYSFVFTLDPSTIHLHRMARRSRDTVFYLPPGVDTSHFTYVPYRERNGKLKNRAFFLGNATLEPRPRFLKAVETAVPDADIRYWKSTVKGAQGWIPLSDHPLWYSSTLLGLNVHRSPWITEKEFRTRILAKSKRVGPVLSGGMSPITQPPQEWGTGFWNDYGLPARHVNPRFFEFAACGTCVISDNTRSELLRMFPWTPRADSPEHFVELVLYYLGHQREAEEIGQACYKEVLKRHTYLHRAAEVLIRVGLKGCIPDAAYTFLGEPKEWLTTQDFNVSGEHQSSEQTGRYARFDPPIGMSLICPSGVPKRNGSLDLDLPWSS